MGSSSQHCSVYRLDGDFRVLSSSRTTEWVWIYNGHAERVAGDALAAELGAAVRRGLEASLYDVAHPSDWSSFNREAKKSLARVGVSSFMRLHRSAMLVEVSRDPGDGGETKVVPHESGGASGPNRGFHSLDALAESLAEPSDEALGRAIAAAFEHCR